MQSKQSTATSIDNYIATFPAHIQAILEEIRSTIKEAVPEAEETISYQIPTFTLHGRYLIYMAGFKKHISLYPAPTEDSELAHELAPYLSGKGTLKFALDKPIPLDLVRKIVTSRAKLNS